jgi:tetratricopeptide (TPR) repeat protein
VLASARMRAALHGGPATASTTVPHVARPPLVAPLLLAPAAALVGAAVLVGGGSDDARIFPIGGGAVLLAAACVAAVLLGAIARPRVGRAGGLLAGCLAAFVLWSGASIAWSIEPDRSWDALNRGVAYVALLTVGIFVGALVPRAPRVVAIGLAAILGLAVVWALAGKVIPALGPDTDRSARLRAPVGYWNALALLVAMSLPLWLWLAAGRRHAVGLRAVGAAMLAATLVALVLTTSRGGIVVGAVAVGTWLVLVRSRLEGVAAILLAAPVATALAAWALSRPSLADAGADPDAAARDGALLGVLLAVGLVLVLALAYVAARQPLDEARRRRLGRLAAGVVAFAAVAALVAGVVRVGDPAAWLSARVDEFRNPPSVQVTQGPERLTAFSSNNRWTWWGEAGRIWEEHPAAGTGAGTFALARKQLRKDTQLPLAPHNVGLQALSETGLVGFLLLAGAVAAAAWAVARTLRRLRGAEHAAAAALAAALAAYLAHSLVDMGWEYVAVSAPFFVALGTLVAAGREPAPRREGRRLGALVVGALAVTLLASLAFPWLAERRLDAAYEALERGDFAAAASDADDAASLNPLSIEPLQVGALAEELRGDLDEAERLLRDAVELQPENGETWYELGRFEFEARGDLENALRHLDRSYALDSFGPSGPVLDDVRAAIARRGAADAQG